MQNRERKPREQVEQVQLGAHEYACKNLTIGVRIYRAYGALGSGFQLLASGNWAPVWHPADSDDPAYCSLGIFLSGTPNHWEWPWAGTDLHPFCKVPAATTFVPDTIRVVVRAKVEGPLWPVYPPVDVRARKHFSLFENPPVPNRGLLGSAAQNICHPREPLPLSE